MDEGDPNPRYILFSDNTTTPVQLNESTGSYFASNGTAEIANSHGLVTGIAPIAFPNASSGSATGYSNHQASASIQIAYSPPSTLNLLNVTIEANFTTYHTAPQEPFTLQDTTGGYNLTISLPPSLPIGDYTLRIDVSSWQYQEPQSQEWIPLHPASFNETLRVTNAPPPPLTPTPGVPGSSGPGQPAPSPITSQASNILISQLWGERMLILSAGLGYLALVSLTAIVVVRQEQARHFRHPTLTSYCQECGNPNSLGSAACPICGKSAMLLQPI